ncbi:sulfite reductase (NADPH) hemoprotein beta-component [Mitsuaria sp. BK045]|uniref:nitrite/sulfite reductase n=1 Tax=unclassified Roseateles TaxID=2626991 RepID=UPI00160753C0|nr:MULTISPECIES: nitrite/sulfite reductase [unclassified Roseateles]MBB3292136.1 sulfite reductase (NADPH) hemoprotein beta-component [Mitsuaria sp. BK041]MBB3361353.1 sulfite reductase (NADPH) hemoprotein beta-component [Mitsuaria sp. BK045]
MYAYTDFDRQFVHARAAQFRDQLERHLAGQLPDDDFRALRLQNGWYIQRHAPMLRIAIPYGVLSSRQLRQLGRIAREHDRGYGHFTTRQNLQFNWIPLPQSADVMDLLADVDMHGIQTSGNCIRNITSDVTAGVAADELIDPRPYAEVLRQWSTLHPEFAFLPRKFKIAISGAKEDRAAIGWHDIGLQLRRNEAGEVGFQVFVGGGMGRTPIIGQEINPFLPWQHILLYLEAIVRTYNRFGRRDNMYKARIKILVKAEGQAYFDAVNAEYQSILNDDAGSHEQIIPEAELARVAASFVEPQGVTPAAGIDIFEGAAPAYRRWLERNVHAHRVSGYRSVTLSLKRLGLPPGDITDAQMDAAADLSDRFSHGELRVSHDQNLLLPWVRESDLPALYEAAKAQGFATPNIGLLTDMIVCPGGDFCALANARSIPVAAEITERFQDLDELWDIGDIDLHISGCINSCGHHHSGHIGVLGVDKDGSEWYQITLGGSDGSTLSGAAVPGKVIGPSFAADEAADAVEAVIATYRREREAGERFLQTVRRIGLDAFKQATNRIRRTTAKQTTD